MFTFTILTDKTFPAEAAKKTHVPLAKEQKVNGVELDRIQLLLQGRSWAEPSQKSKECSVSQAGKVWLINTLYSTGLLVL